MTPNNYQLLSLAVAVLLVCLIVRIECRNRRKQYSTEVSIAASLMRAFNVRPTEENYERVMQYMLSENIMLRSLPPDVVTEFMQIEHAHNMSCVEDEPPTRIISKNPNPES